MKGRCQESSQNFRKIWSSVNLFQTKWQRLWMLISQATRSSSFQRHAKVGEGRDDKTRVQESIILESRYHHSHSARAQWLLWGEMSHSQLGELEEEFIFCKPPVNICLTVTRPSRPVCSVEPMTEACKATLCWHGSCPPIMHWTGCECPCRISLKNTFVIQVSISHLLAVFPFSPQPWYFPSTIFLILVFSISKEGGYCSVGGYHLDEWYWRYAWSIL